jgi:hypothetical protein
VHSFEQRIAETVDREQTLEVGIPLQTLVDVVGEALYFLLGVRPLSARPCHLDQRGMLPEIFRKAVGLRAPELQLLIEDQQKLAGIQRIVSVLIEVLDDLVKPLLRERDLQLPVQFRKFARAEELLPDAGTSG